MYFTLCFENKMSQLSTLQQKPFFLNTDKNIGDKYYLVNLKFS